VTILRHYCTFKLFYLILYRISIYFLTFENWSFHTFSPQSLLRLRSICCQQCLPCVECFVETSIHHYRKWFRRTYEHVQSNSVDLIPMVNIRTKRRTLNKAVLQNFMKKPKTTNQLSKRTWTLKCYWEILTL